MSADNVGGYILDLMLRRLKRHGRIAAWYVTVHNPSMKLRKTYFYLSLSGKIANYNNDSNPVGLRNFYVSTPLPLRPAM